MREKRESPPKRTFLVPLLAMFALSFVLSPAMLIGWIVRTLHRGETVVTAALWSVAALGVALSVGLFAWIARRFGERFRMPIARMNRMVAEDETMLTGRMDVKGADEFGQLARSFNALQQFTAERHRTAERELMLSQRLQRQLLPTGTHRFGDYCIAAACVQTKEVGGDFYDIVPLERGRFAVVIGDAAGKGMQAALLMSGMMALCRRELAAGGEAAAVLGRLNEIAFRALRGRSFVTLGFALFDAERETAVYASAGHMPPFLLRGGRLEEIEAGSLPLGAREHTAYRHMVLPFPPGTRLVLYTDGMVECGGSDGEMLGFETFGELLLALDGSGPPDGQIGELIRQTEAYADAVRADDRTVVLVTREVGAVRSAGK